ncbi:MULTISPECIES: hypothetical protein [unclassified Streptomyces]|uniref:hypothetical protein n=1 Tax=unclassified Streptomyces TaxID=2593676 RepID=UPI001F49A049|nr:MULTISPECIES: hypothetical protein [unclassified Streptomyces]
MPLVIKAHRAVLEHLALKPPTWGRFGPRAGTASSRFWDRRGTRWRAAGAGVRAPFHQGPSGNFKNLIFAADGAKPQIVLRDAVNNDVEIVRHADTCLVFTDPLPPHGLTWRQLVDWWAENHQPGADGKIATESLYRRLYRSLDSPPEQLVMRSYCARYAEEGGFDLPALIPHVYLHYDPYTRRALNSLGRCSGSGWTSCSWRRTARGS